jgi:hypothetical protein
MPGREEDDDLKKKDRKRVNLLLCPIACFGFDLISPK